MSEAEYESRERAFKDDPELQKLSKQIEAVANSEGHHNIYAVANREPYRGRYLALLDKHQYWVQTDDPETWVVDSPASLCQRLRHHIEAADRLREMLSLSNHTREQTPAREFADRVRSVLRLVKKLVPEDERSAITKRILDVPQEMTLDGMMRAYIDIVESLKGYMRADLLKDLRDFASTLRLFSLSTDQTAGRLNETEADSRQLGERLLGLNQQVTHNIISEVERLAVTSAELPGSQGLLVVLAAIKREMDAVNRTLRACEGMYPREDVEGAFREALRRLRTIPSELGPRLLSEIDTLQASAWGRTTATPASIAEIQPQQQAPAPATRNGLFRFGDPSVGEWTRLAPLDVYAKACGMTPETTKSTLKKTGFWQETRERWQARTDNLQIGDLAARIEKAVEAYCAAPTSDSRAKKKSK